MQEEAGKVSARHRLRLVGLGVVAALGLGAGVARASVHTAPSEPAAAATPGSVGGVEVKVDPTASDAETTRGWVESRAATVLAELERPLDEGSLVRIVVRGGAFDYRIKLVLLRNGTWLAPEHQPQEIVCACGSKEMLEQVAAAIEAGAGALSEAVEREREAAAKAEAEAAAREEEERRRRHEAELAATEQQQRAPYKPSVLGRAGIGMLGAGGVLTISGVIMYSQPPQRVNEWDAHEREWANPGAVVLGIGATAMVAGLTVLIVDVVRCRRDRARCGAPTTAWASDGPRSAGRRSGGAW